MSTEAMKVALDALEQAPTTTKLFDELNYKKQKEAIEALRQAIEQAEQEKRYTAQDMIDVIDAVVVSLRREWVGLEDEDVATVKNEFNRGALWAESILKEKNT